MVNLPAPHEGNLVGGLVGLEMLPGCEGQQIPATPQRETTSLGCITYFSPCGLLNSELTNGSTGLAFTRP
jgi:hypothetical protein